MRNPPEPILELQNVNKVYRSKGALFGGRAKDVVALRDVSLQVYGGEICGLVGESGSGKTTVGRLIVGLEDVNAGNILVDGENITGLRGRALKAFRRKVQMIFQDPYQSLNPQRSVLDTVSEPLVIHRLGGSAERKNRAHKALKSAGLTPPEKFFYRYPHRLSGGQRQRVAIARAMVLNPKFVIADEPTSMLDASISAQIFNILLKMRESLDVTQMFITHSLAAARYLCDRIAVIYRGKVMEVGTGETVIRDPRHPYTQALIDALPKFKSRGAVKRYDTLLGKERRLETALTGCPFYLRCAVADERRCHREDPALKQWGDGHYVACFRLA